MIVKTMVDVEGHGEVGIRELTPADYDNLLREDSGYTTTWLDRILDKDNLSGAILSAVTGISVEELAKTLPSNLRPLVDAFKEVNSDFFAAARLEKENVEAIRKMLERDSGGAAAFLSGTGTQSHGDMG